TIKPDVIRKTAKEMFNASPSVIIHPGRHATWYGDDTQRSRLMAMLNALLGSWGQRGGFYKPEKVKVPSFPHPDYPKPTKSWRDAFPDKYKLAGLALSNAMCEATIPTVERECSFRAWIVYGTNLIKTLPDRKTTLKAIQSLDLIVVIDTMPAEITGYADVIFPECTYLERYDFVRASQHRDPYLALRMPAVPPKYDSKPGWWIAKELGLKLGLEEYFKYESIEEVLDWQLKEAGSSLEEMKKLGVKKYDRKYDDLFFTEGLPEMIFNTPTGKIELYSNQFAAAGYDPLPNYTKHMEPPQGFYRLIYGRAPMHTFGRTANNENLTDLMDENSCWINPRVANEWGLKNDQYIWLKNQDDVVSTFSIKVRVTERIRWDSIYMVHGFGHNNKKMTRAHGKGASDSELITRVIVDPIMGGTGMRGNFVTFLVNDPKKEVVS
ncbi:MAG: molybdopterin-dependent oxidoreductase, partial [Bacteroidetes bacterium]|nr:molybdopterin-dependent oxidoreductase [Bacteroidota bacterium]